MLDTPKRNQEQEAVGELRVLMTEVEREAVPASLTTLAEQLGDAVAARTVDDVEPA
jgi:hypothetical protein